MSKVNSIGGDSSPQYSPEDLQKYREDYEKGLELFQKAFDAYRQPDLEFHKKKQLEKVMSEALQVMNETAFSSLKEQKLKETQRLSESYSEFLEHPKAETEKDISETLRSLK